MNFLLKMGIFQPAMLVYQRVIDLVGKTWENKRVLFVEVYPEMLWFPMPDSKMMFFFSSQNRWWFGIGDLSANWPKSSIESSSVKYYLIYISRIALNKFTCLFFLQGLLKSLQQADTDNGRILANADPSMTEKTSNQWVFGNLQFFGPHLKSQVYMLLATVFGVCGTWNLRSGAGKIMVERKRNNLREVDCLQVS